MADVTELSDLVEVYKREVAVPGTFSTIYPVTTATLIVASLCDAFAQAQLDGWFPTSVLDVSLAEVTPALSVAAQALVVVYAGMRFVRAELRATKTSARYKAGSVEYETTQGASVLVAILKDLTDRRAALIDAARAGARLTHVGDGYLDKLWFDRVTGGGARWGFLPYETPMVPAMAYGGY